MVPNAWLFEKVIASPPEIGFAMGLSLFAIFKCELLHYHAELMSRCAPTPPGPSRGFLPYARSIGRRKIQIELLARLDLAQQRRVCDRQAQLAGRHV